MVSREKTYTSEFFIKDFKLHSRAILIVLEKLTRACSFQITNIVEILMNKTFILLVTANSHQLSSSFHRDFSSNTGALVAQSSQQAPFTSEIVGFDSRYGLMTLM